MDFTPEMEVFQMLFERCHTKQERYLSVSICNTSLSGVKFSWTTLYNSNLHAILPTDAEFLYIIIYSNKS